MQTITIFKDDDIEIGYICWRPNIVITVLHVHEEFRNQGYGTLLIKCMLIKLGRRKTLDIKLDDCSDFSGTCNSIYYKLGFRYVGDDNSMFIHIKSVFDFINQIKIKKSIEFQKLTCRHDDEKFKNNVLNVFT